MLNSYIQKSWPDDLEEIVRKKFSEFITRRKTPGLSLCGGVIANKSAKNVQDKVRTIIKQEIKKLEVVRLLGQNNN